MKNEAVLNLFLQEIESEEKQGMVSVEKVKSCMALLVVAVENECQCEEMEVAIDRGKIFRAIRKEQFA